MLSNEEEMSAGDDSDSDKLERIMSEFATMKGQHVLPSSSNCKCSCVEEI